MVPLVSVITPARNVAPWIEAAIRSVLAQTMPDLEHFVVDDGSTDATVDVVASIVDPRLRLLTQPARGASAARNAGLRLSSGPFVAFLDGDDYWTPDKLERQTAILEAHPEIDLTFSWSAIVDEAGVPIGHIMRAAAGRAGFADVFTRDVVGNGSSVVMRRSALERVGAFDETLRAATDFDMWARVANFRRDNCWCVPEVLTVYRRRSGQLTADWRLSQSESEKVVDKFQGPAYKTLRRRAHAANHRTYAFSAYENGDGLQALRLLARAIRFSPLFALADRRTWSLAAAVIARTLLPVQAFERLRAFSRRRLH